MKTIVKIGYIISSLALLTYLALPGQNFPKKIDSSLQSNEPADVETPLRRGYYTDTDRNRALSFYQQEFGGGIYGYFPFLTYRLNYPPEESQTLIRDQTQSTFLEEIVHPMRESIYVNGFEPKQDKDKIIVNGKQWRQKVIVRLVPSSRISRLLTGLLVIILLPVLVGFWVKSVRELAVVSKKIWIYR